MSTTAFPVRQSSGGVGTTDIQLRNIIRYLYPTKGIVGGLTVTGTTSMRYQVAGGLAVCSKGDSDGNTLAYYEGGTTSTVSTNSASNPRIDVVWITSHDVTQGDSDNLVTLGVTVGTAAATPTEPTIPTYATKLASMLVPAGATSTSAASVQRAGTVAIPWGASIGILVDQVDTTNASTAIPSGYRTYASGTFTLPTARYVDIKRVFTLASLTSADASVYTRVLVDGSQVSQGEVRCYGSPALATSQYMENTIRLEAGTHTVQAQMQAGVNTARKYWSSGGWAGQTLQVVDAGVA